MQARPVCVTCGIVAVLAAISQAPGWGERPQASGSLPPALPATAATTNAFRGTGSCAATACHGRSEPAVARVLRNEHTTWISDDRHGDAYTTLFNARSRSIGENLPGPRMAAHENPRCLACHASPIGSREVGQAEVILRDGVGCESCHGPADRWIGEHTREDWASRDGAVKRQFGMFATRELPDRARNCAGCHIGAPAKEGLPLRDVDHDLIAAGHPRLSFEFSAYQAKMPHHWSDRQTPDADGDFAARSWMIGQLISAESSVDLLRDRALRAQARNGNEARAVWPELSEFSCFACHHDLRDEPWRREHRDAGAPPGTLPWASWHTSMLERVAGRARGPAGASALGELAALRGLMSEPRPEPVEVARVAEKASTALGGLVRDLSKRTLDVGEIEALFSAVSTESKGATDASWDRAAQRYLALVALAESLRKLKPGPADAKRVKALIRMKASLMNPTGFDSPRGFSPLAVPDIR